MLKRMFDGADPVAAPVKESAGASRAPAVEKQDAAGPSRGYSINDSDQVGIKTSIAIFLAAILADPQLQQNVLDGVLHR